MDEFELTRRILGEPGEDPDARERIRARLREAIEEERRRRPRSRLGQGLVAAAIGGLAVVVVFLTLPAGDRPAAATELRRLAAIAGRAPEPSLAPGEYVLMRSEELRPETFEFLETGVVFTVVSRLRLTTWIRGDGSGVRRTEVLSSDFASEDDRRTWVEAGRPDVPQAGDVRIERYGRGRGPWFDVSRIPREPGPLLRALRAGQVLEHSGGDDQVFVIVGELLAQGDAPPELRAALLEATSRLEGIRLAGNALDSLGRAGTAFRVTAGQRRTQLIFDADTSHLLAAEEYVAVPDGGFALESWQAYRPARIDRTPPSGAETGEAG